MAWHSPGLLSTKWGYMYVRERDLCQTGKLEFKILAPSRREVPHALMHGVSQSQSHSDLIFELQKLRGDVYREYPGIAATLTPDGRHCQAQMDAESWHIVLQNAYGRIVGCARYRPIRDGFHQLTCSKSALAKSPVSGPLLRSAFNRHFATARRKGIGYGEVGAWAIDAEARCSTAAVSIALMSFALADALGGGMAVTTATTRHHSSAILRRLGASPLGDIAPYFEPMFGCTIEVLQFEIEKLGARFAAKLNDLKAELRQCCISCPIEMAYPEYQAPAGLPFPLGSVQFPSASPFLESSVATVC